MGEIIFHSPEKMNAVNVDQFIHMASPIFQSVDKHVQGVVFDTERTEKVDIIGLLLIYKFYEYTVHKSCFFKPKSRITTKVSKELEKYGLKSLVDNFIRYEKPQYNKLRTKIDNQLIISPILLQKDSTIDEVAQAGIDICKFYSNDKDLQYIILTCMGELAQNFKSHAQSDTTSILSVTGNVYYFEVACVDTGDGVITSICQSSYCKTHKFKKAEVLNQAISIGVSSKGLASGHMGYGLWIIKELVLEAKGDFHLYSEGYYVKIHNGRIKSGQTDFWKGTIVYLKLPTNKSNDLITKLRILQQVTRNINNKLS